MSGIESILSFAHKVEKDNFSYHYPVLTSYFKGKLYLDRNDITVCAYMVYGLMPTILKNISITDENLKLFNKVRKNKEINYAEAEELKVITNNSVIGLSKLLHIIEPEHFAIWDSRVFIILKNYGLVLGKYVNSSEEFINYLKNMKGWISQQQFKDAHETINEKLGYKVTALRALELLMYQKSIKDNKKTAM